MASVNKFLLDVSRCSIVLKSFFTFGDRLIRFDVIELFCQSLFIDTRFCIFGDPDLFDFCRSFLSLDKVNSSMVYDCFFKRVDCHT